MRRTAQFLKFCIQKNIQWCTERGALAYSRSFPKFCTRSWTSLKFLFYLGNHNLGSLGEGRGEQHNPPGRPRGSLTWKVTRRVYWIFSEKGGHWVSDSECEKRESFSSSKILLKWSHLAAKWFLLKQAPEFHSVTCHRPWEYKSCEVKT